jgi:hypothetical protein
MKHASRSYKQIPSNFLVLFPLRRFLASRPYERLRERPNPALEARFLGFRMEIEIV